MNFIVTGTPRSGTTYAAVLFEALGVPCTHEKVFLPQGTLLDAVKWCAKHGGESSWLAWAFLGMCPGPVAIFHQRRDPWRVIDSMAYRNVIAQVDVTQTQHYLWIREVIDAVCPRLLSHDNPVDRAAILVLDWNAAIERAVRPGDRYMDYRVESLSATVVETMLSRIGVVRSEPEIERALATVSKTTNVGLGQNYDAQITEPAILDYMQVHYPGRDFAMRSIEAVQDRKTAEQLAEAMDPDLLEEVNQYAVSHDYEAVEELVAA